MPHAKGVYSGMEVIYHTMVYSTMYGCKTASSADPHKNLCPGQWRRIQVKGA